MIRHAIVNDDTDLVVNVIEYDTDISGTVPPGMSAPMRAVATAFAGIGWQYLNGVFTEINPPPPRQLTADELRDETFLADSERQTLLAQLRNATVAQIKIYVDNNVTDLASARVMLRRIILLLAVAVKR
jgi:hypothetical protein